MFTSDTVTHEFPSCYSNPGGNAMFAFSIVGGCFMHVICIHTPCRECASCFYDFFFNGKAACGLDFGLGYACYFLFYLFIYFFTFLLFRI